MNELEIKKHNFDQAKNRLKAFSEKTNAKLEIDKVRTSDGFWFINWNHTVTGAELNDRLEAIQKHFITVNTTNNDVIKEFREVYNALDTLDKDYITGIVNNLRCIEKTSNDVKVHQKVLKEHQETLEHQQNKLDMHQTELKKTVADISKIVTKLKEFKEELESYKHLTDIDKVWNDCKTIQNEIKVVSDSIVKFSEKTTKDIVTVTNKTKDLIPVIQEMDFFISHLKIITHIDDVDSMWEDINKVKENFVIADNSLRNIKSDILKIQDHLYEIDSFIDLVNEYTHLQDIDNMWDDLAVCKIDIEKMNANIQTHQKELDTVATTSVEHRKAIDALFKNLTDTRAYAVDSRNLITELEAFRAEVSAIDHLMEVDKIWEQMEDHQIRINRAEQESKSHTDKLNKLEQADGKMCESIDSNAYDISALKKYKDKLNGISHLDDVDSIWEDVEEHTSKIVECERRNEDLAVTVQKNKDELHENIAEVVQTTNTVIESLTEKVKYAYWIAGGSAGIAIIELILLFMKVI